MMECGVTPSLIIYFFLELADPLRRGCPAPSVSEGLAFDLPLPLFDPPAVDEPDEDP